MKVVLHISLLANIDKPEDLPKKYNELLPALIKDEKFTILKYETEFVRPPQPAQEE